MIQITPLEDRILDYYYSGSNRYVFINIANLTKIKASQMEDSLQEAALSAVRKQESYNPANPLSPWLNKIFVNKCRDLRRKDKKHRYNSETDAILFLDLPLETQLLNSNHSYEPPPEQPLIDEDRKKILMQAISSLPSKQQQVITEHYLNSRLKYKEIADKLDIPIGTVKSRIHFGIKKLRGLLTAYREEIIG